MKYCDILETDLECKKLFGTGPIIVYSKQTATNVATFIWLNHLNLKLPSIYYHIMVMSQNIHVSSDLNKNEKTADMSGISTCKIFRLHNIFQNKLQLIFLGCKIFCSSLDWEESFRSKYLKNVGVLTLLSISHCRLVVCFQIISDDKMLQTWIRRCHFRFVWIKTTFDKFSNFKPITYIPCLKKFQNSTSTCIKISRIILCRKRNVAMFWCL